MQLLPSFYVLGASCVAAVALALPDYALAADTMAQAPRKLVTLPPDIKGWLKRRAKNLGCAQSFLIIEAVRAAMEAEKAQRRAPKGEVTNNAV